MARVLLLLTTFGVLAAWVGAQGGSPPLDPADRAKLFKTDRALLDQLVNHSLDLSKADNPLRQAQECQAAARTLAVYLRRAAADERDAARVAEMAGLLTDLVRDGLAPNLRVARQTFPDTSPQGEQVKQLGESALKDLEAWAAIREGTVADDGTVKAAFAALAELKAKLK